MTGPSQYGINLPVDILIPVCNEVGVIESVLQEWLLEVERLPKGSKIIVEDAASTDGTIEILQNFMKNPQCKIILHHKRDGFSAALKRLFEFSENPLVFVADSDGQYLIDDFKFFVYKYESGIDFVKGVKVNRRDSWPRRFFSFVFNRFIAIFLNLPPYDFNSSHYLITKELLREISSNGWNFRSQVNVEVGIKAILSNRNYSVVYVRHKSRPSGYSRANSPHKYLTHGYITMRDIWRLKNNF
jgi:hypothetical protein